MKQSIWLEKKGEQILQLVQSELYLDMPYFLTALNSLEFKSDETVTTCATDGAAFYYAPEKMIDLFKRNSVFLNRAYLHSVLHCLYGHLWLNQGRNVFLWNISCDILVEYTMDQFCNKSVGRVLSFFRKETYAQIEKLKGISCVCVYEWLIDQKDVKRYYDEFVVDDHSRWPKEEQKSMPSPRLRVQKKWQNISKQTQFEKRQKGVEKGDENSFLMEQLSVQKKRVSYPEFLRKFCITKEEMHMDLDEMDLTYYTYGLSLYKNMPLIEPVESKEVHTIYEFVIVVDTSYSTHGDLVKKFLSYTYSLLSTSNLFYKQCKVHILQCDDQVRQDLVISNSKEMGKALQSYTLLGGGSTDFRPAFVYVNALIENHVFQNLCGLLYFTDGKGIYPKKRPTYKTAFIYLEDYDTSLVPAWAIQYRLEDEL